MAINAVDRHGALREKWLPLLAPDSERLEFATRLAVICSLTVLVSEIYQTPAPALTAYLAFFLNRPERTMSLILSVALTVVLTVIIALIFFVAALVLDDAMWRVISIAMLSFGFLFLASASRLRPIGGILALIVGYALDVLGTIQGGELATRALLYAWLFVGIPAGVSLLVNLFLSQSPRRAAERSIVDRLKLCAAVLLEPESPARRELAAKVRDGMASVLEQVKLAGIEKGARVADLNALREAALSSFALMSAVDVLAAGPELAGLPCALRRKLADVVEQIARLVQRGRYPAARMLELPREPNLSPLARELVAAIHDVLGRFAEPVDPAPAPASKEGGFFPEDAFNNPEHVQYALKTTAAAVFCYVLYSLLDWPGIHTAFITCYIVAQSTAAESVEKLTLRIIGCLIGAAAGLAAIVFLVPDLTSIGGLMIAVFVGAWAGAYLAAGSPRISYAGFQMAFAFFLCIIQGAGPKFDLTVARDRVIGILLGNLVAYIASVYVWPVTVSRRVDPALAAAFRQLSRIAVAKAPLERRLLASEVQGSLRSTEADVDVAHYEPGSIRSPAPWLAVRRQVIQSVQSLTGLILASANRSELERVDTGRRLEHLARRLEGVPDPEPVRPFVTEPVQAWQTLDARVARSLRALERLLVPRAGDTAPSPHAHT